MISLIIILINNLRATLMILPHDITTFQAVLESAALIGEATNENASQNIKKAQAKHQKDYNNRHSTISTTLPIGSKVLL